MKLLGTCIKYITESVFKLTTFHHLGVPRVYDIDDAKGTAKLTANAVAYHYKNEEALKGNGQRFVDGGYYELDLVKDKNDGLWKIMKWIIHLHWTEGDQQAVFS